MISSLRPSMLFNLLIWLAITVYGGWFLYKLVNDSQDKKPINFGIDLVGGTYLTLKVKMNEAVKNELVTIMESVKDRLKKEKLELPTQSPLVNENEAAGTLAFANDEAAAQAVQIAQDLNRTGLFKISQNGNNLNFNIEKGQLAQLTADTIEHNISILRTRLDAYGAGEIAIFPQGGNIVVELPNVSDPQQAKARIGKAALLEMKPVYDQGASQDELLEKYNGKIPEGSMIIQGSKKGAAAGRGAYLVPMHAKVTGKLLKNAQYGVSNDPFAKGSRDIVQIEFNAEGAQKFYELTKEHVGSMIAIIIDNVVVEAANVNEPIEGGSAQISGSFTEESAKELVTLLKSGAFSAPVEVIEERTIGPSLGKESIEQGLTSCLIGLALLLVFSVLVYRTAGVFAFVVLLYNLLLILFGLALVPDATLTLPGIAGMILTVGMAIDSSILIYERIKEELAAGSSLRKAVDAGFGGALTVILDANITTFIVGAVLYYLGSPAIQGFALALMIGIIATLITGLILLKFIFNLLLDMGVQKIQF